MYQRVFARLVSLLALVAVGVVASSTPASAAPTLSVSPASGLDPAGAFVVVSGRGFEPGTQLFVMQCRATSTTDHTCNSVGLRKVTTDGSGSFTANAMRVVARFGATDCAAVACAIKTSAVSDHADDRSQDRSAAIVFRAAVAPTTAAPATSTPTTAAPAPVAPAPTAPAPAAATAPPTTTPTDADPEPTAPVDEGDGERGATGEQPELDDEDAGSDGGDDRQGALAAAGDDRGDSEDETAAAATASSDTAADDAGAGAPTGLLIGGLVLLVAAGAGATWWVRRRRPQVPATLAVVGLVLAAAVPMVVGGASPAWAASSLTLSKAAGIDPAGEAITVAGSGFDSSRGVYLMFCRQVGASGTPEGRPSGADCSPAQAWVTAPGPGVPPTGTTPWTGTGTFEVTVEVSAEFGTVDCRAEGTVCGFVTRNDHREPSVFDQDSFAPVSFAADPDPDPDPAGPTITVAPTTDLDAAGSTVTVTGQDVPEGRGVYVRFCRAPDGAVGTPTGRPAAGSCDGDGQWVTPDPPAGVELPAISEGRFSVELAVAGAFAADEGVVDCTTAGACGVFVRRDHVGGATDLSLDSFTPLSFDPATEPPVITDPTDPPDDAVTLEVTPSTDLVDGQTINVSGKDFVADQGVYVQYCAAPSGAPGTAAGRATSCYPEQDGTHTVWVTPIPDDGTFSTPLTVVSSFTDGGGTEVDCTIDDACGIFVRRDHNGGTADYGQDAFVPVRFGNGAPIVADPATLTADRTRDLDPDGDQITVEGSGFRPGDPVYVALCDAEVANFAACDFDQLAEVTPSADARALGDAGTFSVELDLRAAFDGTDCRAARCAVQTWSVSGGDAASEVSLPVTFRAAATSRPVGPGPEVSPAPTPDPGPGVDGGTLARTGGQPAPLVLLALSSVALGIALLAGRRPILRRRART